MDTERNVFLLRHCPDCCEPGKFVLFLVFAKNLFLSNQKIGSFFTTEILNAYKSRFSVQAHCLSCLTSALTTAQYAISVLHLLFDLVPLRLDSPFYRDALDIGLMYDEGLHVVDLLSVQQVHHRGHLFAKCHHLRSLGCCDEEATARHLHEVEHHPGFPPSLEKAQIDRKKKAQLRVTATLAMSSVSTLVFDAIPRATGAYLMMRHEVYRFDFWHIRRTPQAAGGCTCST